jgi:hypothetical protein
MVRPVPVAAAVSGRRPATDADDEYAADEYAADIVLNTPG